MMLSKMLLVSGGVAAIACALPIESDATRAKSRPIDDVAKVMAAPGAAKTCFGWVSFTCSLLCWREV